MYAAGMTPATTARITARPPVRLTAGALEVTFEWVGDRWRHRVSCAGRPVAESLEGPGPAGDPRWPASPALQEVTTAMADGGMAIVAVGAACRAHFSASLRADAGHADTVLVEAACRIVEPAGWLGSTYRDAAGGTARIQADAAGAVPRTVCWSYRIGPQGVTAAGGPGATLAIGPAIDHISGRPGL